MTSTRKRGDTRGTAVIEGGLGKEELEVEWRAGRGFVGGPAEVPLQNNLELLVGITNDHRSRFRRGDEPTGAF
jgi:hypothetical protein